MALDMSYKGKEIGTYTFQVDRSKIRELAAAVGDPNPVFTDTEAARKEGYRDCPAPLTFATVMTFGGYPQIWDRMTAMGIDTARAFGALRLSVGRQSIPADLDHADDGEAFVRMVEETAVAERHGAHVVARLVVAHAVPPLALVLHEVVVGEHVGFGLEQPVGSHDVRG